MVNKARKKRAQTKDLFDTNYNISDIVYGEDYVIWITNYGK
jgi:alpha-tubulin suppressor-like RCC1 family protein